MFTTSNNSFGPTEISYRENRFCNLAINAKRYVIKNGNDPSQGHITEEKESELEEFIDYAKIIMATLGHKIFIPVDTVSTISINDNSINETEPVLYLKTTKVKATGRRTSDGFVVFKNSEVSPNPTKSCPDTIHHLREQNAERINADYLLTEDTLFSSPSAAAGFVTYASANGLIMWAAKDGKTLRELESEDK
ncbi:DUF4357 domain-containing protein [Pseudoneobacillus sp. C159]